MCVTQGRPRIVFDVFGRVADGALPSSAREKRWGEKGLDVDWATFADAWRGRYAPSMDRVRRGKIAWTRLGDLHCASLEELLGEFGIEGLTDTEKFHFNRAWHRLDPWSDAVEGHTRRKFARRLRPPPPSSSAPEAKPEAKRRRRTRRSTSSPGTSSSWRRSWTRRERP